MQPKDNEYGFTLIEIVIALSILTVGVLSLNLLQVAAIKGNMSAQQMTGKTFNVGDRLERQLSLSYSSNTYNDADNDSVGKDLNGDGRDDGGNNFGLDDAQCCQNGRDPAGIPVAGCTERADYCDLQDDSFIYWNVANDVPITCSKTVKVLVRNRNVDPQKTVYAEYVKSDPYCN